MRSLLGLLCGLLLSACSKAPSESALDLSAALGGQAEQGFSRATEARRFQFPRDHAAHPDFRNEWWYITGNLRDAANNRYGYQVTLFRIALTPQPPQSPSDWATNQVWMAHVALTDVSTNQHWHDQRLARGAVGLAGQSEQPFRVWLEDWQILASAKGEFPWTIEMQTEQFGLHLQLNPVKPVVLQGNHGLSQKSNEPGNASYYYSFTRLQTSGEIQRGEQRITVSGESWLDREWSTSALGPDQVGWDWFSLQLQDQYELMFYRLRLRDGTTDPHSAGKWIFPEGGSRSLTAEEVSLQPLRYWTAPSGRRYPIEWKLTIPGLQRDFLVAALVEDQEMTTGIHYWEGAVQVTDALSGDPLGYGYLEMTGY